MSIGGYSNGISIWLWYKIKFYVKLHCKTVTESVIQIETDLLSKYEFLMWGQTDGDSPLGKYVGIDDRGVKDTLKEEFITLQQWLWTTPEGWSWANIGLQIELGIPQC